VKTCTATGAEDISLGKVNGIAGKVIDSYIISGDSATPTVTLKNGSDPISSGMVKSATTYIITRSTKAGTTVENGDELFASFNGAGVADVVILIAPTSIPD